MAMRILKDEIMHVAEEDILVYKVYRKITDEDTGEAYWQSPYQNMRIPDPYSGLQVVPETDEIDRHASLIIGDENELVGKGLLHCWHWIDDINLDYIGMPDCHVWHMVIPKGTEFIIGMDGCGIAARKLEFIGAYPLDIKYR